MIGGYDPSYNPENLKKKSAESKELDPQQAAMASKWSDAMEGVGETGTTLETAAEAETPNIPEDEQTLQNNLEENMDNSDELPTTDAGDDATPIGAAASAATEGTTIQHFSPDNNAASTFAPLSPEEQRSKAIAAEAAHGKTYSEPGEDQINSSVHDDDNLVAKAVSENLGAGGVDLNEVGQKLEAEGVDITSEANSLEADAAADISAATTSGDPDNIAHDAVTANNLSVEGGAFALAAKKTAGEAVEEAKHGGDDALAKIAEANRLADKAEELAGASQEVNAAAGNAGAETINSQAIDMAKEAKDIAEKAAEITEAKEAEEAKADEEKAEEPDGEKPKAEDQKEDDSDEGSSVFSADKYPELNDIGDGEIGTITSTAA